MGDTFHGVIQSRRLQMGICPGHLWNKKGAGSAFTDNCEFAISIARYITRGNGFKIQINKQLVTKNDGNVAGSHGVSLMRCDQTTSRIT